MINIYHCLRCGHEWPSRKEISPKVCPKCKSPYWNMPKWKGVNIMMEPLLDLLKDITESLTADSLSPIPGFFTLRTIARMLVMGGYEGRGRSGNLSLRQLGIVRNLLDSYFETKPAGKRRVYGRRIR